MNTQTQLVYEYLLKSYFSEGIHKDQINNLVETQKKLVYEHFSEKIDKRIIDLFLKHKDLSYYLEDIFYKDVNSFIYECSMAMVEKDKSITLQDLVYDLVTEEEIDFQAIADKLKEQQP